MKCHKIILSKASKYFEEKCTIQNDPSDDEPLVVELERTVGDGAVIEVALRHMYSFTYSEIQQDRSEFMTPRSHLAIVMAARKMALPQLEQQALKALYETIDQHVELCANRKRAGPLADCIIFLMECREHDEGFESRAKDLVKEHLLRLWDVQSFRMSFEERDGKISGTLSGGIR